MPVTIGVTKYYLVGQSLLVDSTGNPMENRTGGVVKLPGTETVVALLEFPSQVPLASLTSDNNGLVPAFYAALPDGLPMQWSADFDDDDIPPQLVYADASENDARVEAVVDAKVAEATASLPANVTALTETVTELEASAVKGKAGFAVTAIAVIGGTYGLPADSEAGVLYFRIPDAS